MTMNTNHTGRATSIPKGLAISGALATTVTIIGSGIIATLINTQMITESNIGYAIMIMLIVTSYLCSLTAWIKIKHRRLLVCISAGCVYFAILMSITAMFFGGQYSSVWETALLVLCGCLLATMHEKKTKKRKKYRKAGKAYR